MANDASVVLSCYVTERQLRQYFTKLDFFSVHAMGWLKIKMLPFYGVINRITATFASCYE